MTVRLAEKRSVCSLFVAVWCLGMCFLRLLGITPRFSLDDADGLAKLAADSKLECIDFAAVRTASQSSTAENLLSREPFASRLL